ncbi:MAG TPA: hypothetical protein VMV04_09670 [Thermodesulfobacteriota bacterium]|nr:hypothetical protein [Thermodesulfobacteriota bacterium]
MRWTFWLVGRQLQAVMVAVFLTVALGFLAMLPFGSAPVMAQEYIRNKEPVPESVDQVTSPIELSFKERPKIPRFFPWLKEQLKERRVRGRGPYVLVLDGEALVIAPTE